jgi:hypothetical protein
MSASRNSLLRPPRPAAARDQRKHKVLGGKMAHRRQNLARGQFAVGVRHRMGGFEDADPFRRDAVAVGNDDDARERLVRPRRLDRRRH